MRCLTSSFSLKNRAFSASLDAAVKKAEVGITARDTFRRMDSRAQSSNSNDTEVHTQHQNTVNSVRAFAGSREHVEQYSTSGIDGKLIIWSTHDIAQTLANLHL